MLVVSHWIIQGCEGGAQGQDRRTDTWLASGTGRLGETFPVAGATALDSSMTAASIGTAAGNALIRTNRALSDPASPN